MSDAILVLGAGGFIGKALVRQMSMAGNTVIALGGEFPDLANVEQVATRPQSPADLREMLQRSRAIVHLASTSTPGGSAGRPLREVETNLRLTAMVLEAMQAKPQIDLLYFSSGGALYADPGLVKSREGDRLLPRSYHGAAKLAAEAFINAWCVQYKGRAVVLRPSNVYGPGQPERAGFGIVPAAMGAVLRGETLPVWGDGLARRDYVYLADLLRLCDSILSRPMASGCNVLNACSGESITLNALFDLVERVSGMPLQRCYQPDRSVDAASIAMDPGLAERLYGWHERTPLEEGLKATWDALVNAAVATP